MSSLASRNRRSSNDSARRWVSIEGENLRQVTWVVVEEVKSGEWGIAGQPLTTEAVRKLAAGG